MEKTWRKEIAIRMKKRRLALNYTQEQFAEVINIAVSSYTKIENAFQQPSLETLIKIANALHISLDYLVHGNGDNEAAENKCNEADIMNIMEALVMYCDPEKMLHASEILNKLAKIKKNTIHK